MRDILLTALAPLAWGATYVVTTQLLPPERPLFVSVARALPTGLLILAGSGQLPKGVWYWRALVLGALNIGIFFALLFTAAYRLPGGVVATVMAFQPFVVAALARAFLGERVTTRLVAAACAGAFGVGLIVLSPAARLDAVGVAVAVAATLAWACGTVLTKRWGQPAPLLVFTSWQLVAGGLILLPFAFVLEGMPPPLSAENVAGFMYLCVVGTGLAYALWFRGIKRLAASTVAFLGLLSPVSAMLIDVFVLRRVLGVVQVLGTALVLLSILAAQGVNARGRRGAVRES
jgi:probable blue pigment (indigoidine) exporter